jgi:hypothetical protein
MRAARELLASLIAVVIIAACSTASPATSSRTPDEASDAPSLALSPSSTLPSPTASPSASTSAAPSTIAGPSPVPSAVWVPGTHVSIVPPPGFEPSTTEGAGFRDTASDAVISIQELPGGPFDRTDAAYAQQGFVVEDRQSTTVDGLFHILVQGTQTLQDQSKVGTILLSLGREDMSTLIVAQHAVDDEAAHASILAALETARLDPARAIEPGLAIAFDVTPAPPLRLAGMLGQGATYNTLGRKHHPLDAGIPTMNLYVRAEPPPDDAAAFLREQLDRNGQQLFDPKVQLEAGVVIDDLEGFQIVASALDALKAADRELFVYEVFVPGPDGNRYVQMEAIATADLRDQLLPAFRETALSFKWRDAP